MIEKNNRLTKEEVGEGVILLAKSSVIVFIGLFLSKVLNYTYKILIVRYFGLEVFGFFSLAIIIIGWFIAFSSLGVIGGLLRYIPLYRGKKQFKNIKYILRLSIILLLFSGILSAILLFFLSDEIAVKLFHNQNLIIFLKVFSFLIPFTLFSNIFLNVLRAFEKIGWYSFIFNILSNISKLLFIIIFMLLGFKTNAVIFSYSLSVLVMLSTAFLVCKNTLPWIFGLSNLKRNTKKEIRKGFISYSWPIMISGIISSIFYWIDSLSIGYFKNATDVGLYSVAFPIALLMSFVPEIFIQLFFPLINRQFSLKNFALIKELSQQVGKWVFIINLPLFLILMFFPGAILNIFFGPSSLVAGNTLRILSVGVFISSLVSISTSLVQMAGKSKIILMNIIFTSILNLILNILFIPKYGIEGAAIATTIVTILLSFILLIEAKYYTSIIPVRRKLSRVFAVSIIPLIILLLFKQITENNITGIILLSIFFILSYIFLIFITGCLDQNDFAVLKSIKRELMKVRK